MNLFANDAFNGRIAFVTGATRGIGLAIAERLADAGAFVIGTATSETGAASISEKLGARGRGRRARRREPRPWRPTPGRPGSAGR